jgi:uncharacterized protein YehS (DUF1456 family)
LETEIIEQSGNNKNSGWSNGFLLNKNGKKKKEKVPIQSKVDINKIVKKKVSYTDEFKESNMKNISIDKGLSKKKEQAFNGEIFEKF